MYVSTHVCEGELYGSSRLTSGVFLERFPSYPSYVLRQDFSAEATLLTLNSFAIQLAAEISCFYLLCTRIMGWSLCKTGISVGAGDLKFSLYNCSAST